ncbi:MAG: CYTH domain-containing protein, partial [Alloprevotella tannerae]|nr:CYTH domain-containing protein [Alloprevotella tannerae]
YKDFATSHYTIRQGYICSGGGRTVRVRLCGERGFLTIKGPSLDGGLSRFEFEKEITENEALALLFLCEPGLVEKVRWLIPNGKHTIEVDEFLGENEGLVVAEIELHSPDEPYLKPDFLGQEVTGEARYYNSQLRRNPYKNW